MLHIKDKSKDIKIRIIESLNENSMTTTEIYRLFSNNIRKSELIKDLQELYEENIIGFYTEKNLIGPRTCIYYKRRT